MVVIPTLNGFECVSQTDLCQTCTKFDAKNHALFAANTYFKTHFSIFRNFSKFENVEDGRFGGSTATLSGWLSLHKQGTSTTLLIVVCDFASLTLFCS